MSQDSETPGAEDLARHTALVALTLSGVERLQMAFFHATSPTQQRSLLLAAGDVLDRTLPDKDLKSELASLPPEGHVAKLIEQRTRLSAIPPKFWRSARVSLSDLGQAHYSGYRALEGLLRKSPGDEAKAWAAVSAWLAPVWAKYPVLEHEVRVLSKP